MNEAARRGQDPQQFVHDLLARALEQVKPQVQQRPSKQADAIVPASNWTAEDAAPFLEAISDQRQIDAELWR